MTGWNILAVKMKKLFICQIRNVLIIVHLFQLHHFFFEIDRRKGPPKENGHNPIIGTGLLLDAGQVPVGMKIYLGNESEKPVIMDFIHDLKQRSSISRKNMQAADKRINCAENIVSALKAGDGYSFSKSVKQLPGTEKI